MEAPLGCVQLVLRTQRHDSIADRRHEDDLVALSRRQRTGACAGRRRASRSTRIAHYLFHRSTTQIGPSCYLQDLYTADAARGKGIARALIQEVYGHAASAGAPRVYWQTHDSNTRAMALYDKVAEKSGFLVYRKML